MSDGFLFFLEADLSRTGPEPLGANQTRTRRFNQNLVKAEVSGWELAAPAQRVRLHEAPEILKKTPSDTLSVWVAEDKRLDETQQSVCDIWSSELLHTVFIILYQSAGVDCVEAEVISQR